MKRLQAIAVNLLVLAATSAVLFAVCELAVRVFYKDSIALTPRYHTAATYGDVTLRRIRSNMEFTHTTVDGSWEFSTNAQGFRNHADFSYAKPPGRIRVVALGDSHTQGYECAQDQTYSAVIERYLRARGMDAEVLNTGVSGFSTAEALLLLEREMVKYSPDFVVLGFFANDYEDNLKAGLFRLDKGGQLHLVKNEHIPGVKIQDLIYAVPGIPWLGENSYFYSLLFNTVWDLYKRQLTQAAREQIPDEAVIATKSRFSDYEVELTAALIERINEVANESGAKFLLLDVPGAVKPNGYKPSIVESLRDRVAANVDFIVTPRRADPLFGRGGHARTERRPAHYRVYAHRARSRSRRADPFDR